MKVKTNNFLKGAKDSIITIFAVLFMITAISFLSYAGISLVFFRDSLSTTVLVIVGWLLIYTAWDFSKAVFKLGKSIYSTIKVTRDMKRAAKKVVDDVEVDEKEDGYNSVKAYGSIISENEEK